jgi:lipoprotein-anchoring transpeptidase ErfK/SrfK
VAGGLLVSAAAMAQDPPPAPSATPPGIIAEGVKIDGLPVGGLTRPAAKALVLKRLVAPKRKPLALRFGKRRFAINPVSVGYRADVDYAIRGAYTYGHTRPVAAKMNVPLRESVNRAKLRAVLATKSGRVAIPAVDAAVSFSGGRPVVRKARTGARVRLAAALRIVERALLTRTRRSYRLPPERVLPAVTTVPTTIFIQRDRFKLTLVKSDGKQRTFGIAVGQPAYPTPVGNFSIVTKQVNPTWFPPDSPWAAGIGPVAPGPSNPLGTRWMGTSATAIGIHGTPSPGTIGTRASHGCVRMRIPEAEYLFDQISVGTQVVIR